MRFFFAISASDQQGSTSFGDHKTIEPLGSVICHALSISPVRVSFRNWTLSLQNYGS